MIINVKYLNLICFNKMFSITLSSACQPFFSFFTIIPFLSDSESTKYGPCQLSSQVRHVRAMEKGNLLQALWRALCKCSPSSLIAPGRSGHAKDNVSPSPNSSGGSDEKRLCTQAMAGVIVLCFWIRHLLYSYSAF